MKKEPALEREDPPRCSRAVFRVLARRVSAGEIERVKRMLPEPIRSLWPPPEG